MTHPLAHVHALIGDAIDWMDRGVFVVDPANPRRLAAVIFAANRTTECLNEALAELDEVKGLPEEVEVLRRVIAELGGRSS